MENTLEIIGFALATHPFQALVAAVALIYAATALPWSRNRKRTPFRTASLATDERDAA